MVELVATPNYHEDGKALLYFSNKCFYVNKDFMIFGPQLRKELLGKVNMRDVIQQLKWEEDYDKLAGLIIGGPCAQSHGGFAITGSAEIKVVFARPVPSASTAAIDLSALLEERTKPIFLVMVPSGSSKTFFRQRVGETSQTACCVQHPFY